MLRRLVERVRPERLLYLRKPTEAIGARRQARGFTADAKVEISPSVLLCNSWFIVVRVRSRVWMW